MTVSEARRLMLNRHQITGPHELSICDDGQLAIIKLMHWLHRLSSERMDSLYGPCPASHPDYPPDVDAATVMTDTQITEFYSRLEAIGNG